MKKMTSAYASKLIRKLEEDKEYWQSREASGSTYIASLDEEPVIPDYDFKEVQGKITEIDAQIVKIKHALNVANCTSLIQAGERQMAVDEILVAMVQLNRRKAVLDLMRKREPKARVNSSPYAVKKASPEYEYINYDLSLVKEEYERIDSEISEMQIALDRHNQTDEFEVDI